jgi:outer membrane lipoprotein SlyB
METAQKFRIHPLVAGAAVAVIIASAVGVAAMTGNMPGSNAAPAAVQPLAVAPAATEPAVAPPPAAPAPALSPSQKIAEEALATTQPPPPPAPLAQAAPAAPPCTNCGVVESVNPYTVKPKNSTVGMIGGAVVGGLVGNQIGDGTTNAIATVGGAAGGAYLGNEIGKRVEKGKTRYRVVLRMDDGRTKTVTYGTPPAFAVGTHVRLENGKMLPA